MINCNLPLPWRVRVCTSERLLRLEVLSVLRRRANDVLVRVQRLILACLEICTKFHPTSTLPLNLGGSGEHLFDNVWSPNTRLHSCSVVLQSLIIAGCMLYFLSSTG